MYSDFCIDLRIGDPIAMSVHHTYLKSDENFKGFFTSLQNLLEKICLAYHSR